MNQTPKPLFDNVFVRLKENRPAISSVGPPFRIAHWQDLEGILSELALPKNTVETIHEPAVQEHFLSALSSKLR